MAYYMIKTARRAPSHVIRDISPKRVYACNKESHAELPALFKQPKALEHLRPVRTQQLNDNGSGKRQPRLLQKLEHLLEDKLAMAENLAIPFSNTSNASVQQGASNMRLDAYRQAFEAFIHSFTTYRPLLLRIKAQYDVALEDALESAHENVHMKSELAVIEQRRLRAVEEARVEASKMMSESRRELEHRLMEMEERAAMAEERSRNAEAEARLARAEEERSLKEIESYIDQCELICFNVSISTLFWARIMTIGAKSGKSITWSFSCSRAVAGLNAV
eukprot:scaffold30748_cov43-Prasinocladus_malaysianus.AAC.5